MTRAFNTSISFSINSRRSDEAPSRPFFFFFFCCKVSILGQGRSQGRGVLGCLWPPLLWAFFKQTTYNRWRKRHDNLVITLILTHCDPPLRNPGYAPARLIIRWRAAPQYLFLRLIIVKNVRRSLCLCLFRSLFRRRNRFLTACFTPSNWREKDHWLLRFAHVHLKNYFPSKYWNCRLRPSLPEDQAGVIHAISPFWMQLCQIEGTTQQL